MQRSARNPSHVRTLPFNRREMLRHCGSGFGSLALAALLTQESNGLEEIASRNPLSQHAAHFMPKAKRVIFLFMPGGPSHVDLFDPKPKLAEMNGQAMPRQQSQITAAPAPVLMQSPFKFQKHGHAGIDICELFPRVARCADDLCVIRSMVADNSNHNGACLQMNTGEQAFSRPSMGAWILYGLGSENQDLPGFVVISPNQPAQGAPLWGSSFLPASFQGTFVSDVSKPVSNLQNARFSSGIQRDQLDLLKQLNGVHRENRAQESQLNARIAAFELAFRMQAAAPDAFDITRESEVTHKLYGVGDPVTDHFGKQCLLARRLVERGVRFVQLFHTRSSKVSGCQTWDHHGAVRQGLIDNTAATDIPIAGLLNDLKSRGLLQETLVIWGGEFGRTPTLEGNDGRGHHPYGFTMWLAGGGVKSGIIHGATDEFGWHSVHDKVHVHDLHATILHLLGLDHTRLTYRYSGRDYRLTDVYGDVVQEILA